MVVRYQVCVIESELGWGQTREYALFDKVEDAIRYRDGINAKNKPSTVVPDWYVIAEHNIKVVEQ
jgi:hypothetical protein